MEKSPAPLGLDRKKRGTTLGKLRYRRTRELMEAQLGDELDALDAEAGDCFGFNGVATSVWKLLEEPRSFDQLRSALLDEYEVEPDQCTRELQDLIADLQSKGLVTRV